ncbi:MAG: rhodanese-like domain-containing protein [Cyanobacteria bacterium P01_A01_bin.105]
MPLKWITIGVFVLGLSVVVSCGPVTGSVSWSGIKQAIQTEFPSVRQISTDLLSDWLTADPLTLLLDTREPEEYAVSHLPGAILATTLDEALAALEKSESDRPVVVYCSVGYRSSALAEQLMQAGYTEVYNLEGSLFAWANEGRPVYQGQTQVEQVHPYDSKWGQLLVRSRRADLE